MSPSGLVKIPRLEGEAKFPKWSADPGTKPAMACEQQGVRIVIPVKTGIQKTEEDTGFLLEFTPMKIGAGMTDRRTKMGKVASSRRLVEEPLVFKARVLQLSITLLQIGL